MANLAHLVLTVSLSVPAPQASTTTLSGAAVRLAARSARVVETVRRDPGLLYIDSPAAEADAVDAAPPASLPARAGSAALRLYRAAPAREAQAPPPPPAPAEARSLLLARLESRIDAHGASPRAVAVARRLMARMLEHADRSTLERLDAAGAEVEIIPRGKRLTDLPHFRAYSGTRTFDGRLWDKVRGMGHARWADGRGVSCAVAEENLVDPGGESGYPAGFLFVHEFAHLVHYSGLSVGGAADGPRANDVAQAYAAVMRRRGLTGLGAYADANEREAFAEAAAAYFGVSDEGIGRRTLARKSPELYGVVVEVFGPAGPASRPLPAIMARAERPSATPASAPRPRSSAGGPARRLPAR